MENKITPFSFVNDLSYKKENIFNEETEPYYISFIINKALSNFIDVIYASNEMNLLSHLPKKLQNDFYINIIRPNKRWSKWNKKINNDDVSLIMNYYGFNNEKALNILKLLTRENLNKIKDEWEKGK